MSFSLTILVYYMMILLTVDLSYGKVLFSCAFVPGNIEKSVSQNVLTFTTVWTNSADDKLMIFFFSDFFQKTKFDS